MSENKTRISGDALRALIVALVLEGVCIFGGVAAFFATDKIIWILIGVVAGAGFSAPALIKFVRVAKGRKDA